MPLRRYGGEDDNLTHIELADQDFGGEGTTPEEAEVYFEVRDATLQSAYPVFIDGREAASRSGYLSDVNRRRELAAFVLKSREMPRAAVNRLWAVFFSHGFTTPVDDMGPHNPPSHPELLDLLSTEFARNNYDLRLLMKWMVNSEAYGLSSRMTQQNELDDPSKGERALFSHYYLRQMQAEQLFDSLITATAADQGEGREKYDATRRQWLRQFVVAFGNDEGTEGTTFDGTITQSLVLFNGELMREAMSLAPGSFLSRLNTASGSLDQKVNHLYITALSRTATKKELLAARQLVRWRGGNQGEALQDIWWAILNCNEFILNH